MIHRFQEPTLPISNAAYQTRLKRRARLELNKLLYRLRKCPLNVRTEEMDEIREHRFTGIGSIQHFLARALIGIAPESRLSGLFGEMMPYVARPPENNRLKWETSGLFGNRIMGRQEAYASLRPAAEVLFYLSDRDFDAFYTRVTAKDTAFEKIAALKRKNLHNVGQLVTCKVPHYARLLISSSYRQAYKIYRHAQTKERA